MLFMLPNSYNEVLASLKHLTEIEKRENVATAAHEAFGRRHDVLPDVFCACVKEQ